jgi:hypothetical protein
MPLVQNCVGEQLCSDPLQHWTKEELEEQTLVPTYW